MKKRLITAYLTAVAMIVLTGLIMGMIHPAFATRESTSAVEETTKKPTKEHTTTTEAPTTTRKPTTTEAPTTTKERSTTKAPTTTEEPTETTAEPTTTEAPKHHIYFIETGATGTGKLLKTTNYLMVTDKRTGTPIWEMGNVISEGEVLHIEKLEPEEGIYTISRVIIWRKDKEGSGDTGKHDGITQNGLPFDWTVGGDPLIFEVCTIIDAAKESRSIAESESIEESKSIAESESISRSEQEESESISRSEQEERDRLNLEYGGYTIFNDLTGIAVPYDTFFSARDTTTFRKSINAFYSSSFRVFVYYAAKSGWPIEEGSYYVENPLTASLIPFKVITDQDGAKYVVTAAKGVNTIPGTYKRENIVALNDSSGNINRVNGYVIEDPFGESLNLLALSNAEGKQGFYVFKAVSGGYTLTPYDEYESEKGTEAPTTTVPPETTEPPKESSILKNGAIWLVILGGVAAVILTAVLIVFFMSRKQQREEDELDLTDEEGDEDSEEDQEEFGEFTSGDETEEIPFDLSSYRNPSADDGTQGEQSFDVNFEDAFPDEVRTAVVNGQGAGEEVAQAFDFTFDFGKAKNSDEPEPQADEVTYVDLSKEDVPKKPKVELNGEEFEEIHYGPTVSIDQKPEGR